ncbi:MAG: hypothetical protein F6K08_35700 [Okeania sp. SIO1H6]|nr:hypothetical protein [Okeania sp. SIO1H6]
MKPNTALVQYQLPKALLYSDFLFPIYSAHSRDRHRKKMLGFLRQPNLQIKLESQYYY